MLLGKFLTECVNYDNDRKCLLMGLVTFFLIGRNSREARQLSPEIAAEDQKDTGVDALQALGLRAANC